MSINRLRNNQKIYYMLLSERIKRMFSFGAHIHEILLVFKRISIMYHFDDANLNIIGKPSIEDRSLKPHSSRDAARAFPCSIVAKCHVKYCALLNIHLTRINYILPRGCNPGFQREFSSTAYIYAKGLDFPTREKKLLEYFSFSLLDSQFNWDTLQRK